MHYNIYLIRGSQSVNNTAVTSLLSDRSVFFWNIVTGINCGVWCEVCGLTGHSVDRPTVSHWLTDWCNISPGYSAVLPAQAPCQPGCTVHQHSLRTNIIGNTYYYTLRLTTYSFFICLTNGLNFFLTICPTSHKFTIFVLKLSNYIIHIGQLYEEEYQCFMLVFLVFK